MPKENVELAHRVIGMFNERNLDGFLALQAEDVRFEPRLVPMEGGYRGHGGVRTWWENLLDEIPDFSAEVVEVPVLADDLVVAVVHSRGHGAQSAAPFEDTIWVPIRIRDGKAVWWGVFMTEQKAVEAAGLSE